MQAQYVQNFEKVKINLTVIRLYLKHETKQLTIVY